MSITPLPAWVCRANAAAAMQETEAPKPIAAQPTPGPWNVEPGHKRGVYVVVRAVKPGFVQYLGANGKAKGTASNFRSKEAAEAAIAKATAPTKAEGASK